MNQNEEMNYVVMDKKEIKKCRHKVEKRWYRRLVILNIIIIVSVVGFFISEMKENQSYLLELQTASTASFNAEGEEAGKAQEELDKKIDEVPDSVTMFGTIFVLLIGLPFVVSYVYASYRSMSVKITEKNFPEIYSIVKEYSHRLGMKKVPSVYLVQKNRISNAFAACIPFKQYIELYADLVEVAYREHHDMETLRFIIAHEIAHIYLGHATLS